MNYYNDNDPGAARWLRNLIEADLIPNGHVDQRSIKEVQADDLAGYTQCHFFAGVAGWSLALQIAGWPDDAPVWTGSCPCQPFSAAGKRKGTADERHLWPDFHRLIAECGPPIVFGEQVASADGREWLAGVRADLEALGYAVGAADLCAAGSQAPVIRQRLWWLAESNCFKCRGQPSAGEQPEHESDGCLGPVARSSRNGRRQGSEIIRGRDSGIQAEGDRGGPTDDSAACAVGGTWCNGRDEGADSPSLEKSNTVRPGPWDNFAVVDCDDGTQRRFERGSYPLAYGIPISLGRGRTRRERMAIRAARANRVCRLKGYGNAINPWVAAEFIVASTTLPPG